jgi:hypothetical protein
MSLQPLQAFAVASHAADCGPRPELAWVEIDRLRVDDSYQRPIIARGRKTIAAIVANFSWAKFSPLILAPVPGSETFAIIDGQHRATAALILGYRKVPASICQVPAKDQARIFAAVNGTVTPMSMLALFKAAKLAGEAWALEVETACRMAGLTPLTYPVSAANMKPFQTMAVGTLRKYVARHGAEAVGQALAQAARKPAAETIGYFNATRLREAVTCGRATSIPQLPEAEIAARLQRGQPASVIAAALKVSYADVEHVRKRLT